MREAAAMRSKAILIACQDDLGTRSLTTFFHSMGYRVEVVSLVSQMIRRVLNGTIHVLLLEDEVEGLKAWELVPLLKWINRRIQVIVISSEESLGAVRRLRGAGIFYHAMKPADLGELKSAVESALEKIKRESFREGLFSLFLPSRGLTLYKN